MKAIILASGEWSRLRPLTDTTPKPLIKILWRTIIEYNLEILKNYVDECIIVVKYKSEIFQSTLWKDFKWMKLSYHIQWDKPGTAAALQDINLESKDNLIILYWDSIYSEKDIKNILTWEKFWCLVKQVNNPEVYGIFEEQNGKALRVVEKPQDYIGNLANMGWFYVSSDIISLCREVKISSRWEYEITDAINAFIKTNDFILYRLSKDILDIWYAWNLLDANKILLETLTKSHIQWTIENNVHINGNIILEKWALIKSGTYIEWNCYFGKNTIIWPNAYIRWNTSLWDGSKIWFCVEVKNSYIWENSKIPHLSYVGDSIVGNNVNLWGGFKVANLRHDGGNIQVMVKKKLIDTGKKKLGCIIWDRVKTWINTQLYPGRILETWTSTLPWEIVK